MPIKDNRIHGKASGIQPSNEDDDPSESSQDETSDALVPSEDLTRYNYETHHSSMTDKQLFSWAYKTETKIRFQKLESRGDGEGTARSTTLASEYLIISTQQQTNKTKILRQRQRTMH